MLNAMGATQRVCSTAPATLPPGSNAETKTRPRNALACLAPRRNWWQLCKTRRLAKINENFSRER
eukprot:4970979-Lingulodinium_polyedra.AAC.1